MDENNQNDQAMNAPAEATTEMSAQPQATMQSSTNNPPMGETQNMPSSDYAGFLKRFLAVLIDGILIALVTAPLPGNTVTYGDGSAYSSNPWVWPVSAIYGVFMISKYGATLGKMAMKIRVQNMETGANLTIVEAILREVVGKFLSSLVIGLGYFWMLWDKDKQTWHDKIAKSVVVNSKSN